MFTSKPLMRLAIEHKNGYEFMGRELRIKKAVSAIRLEKKKIRKADRGRVKEEEAVMRAEARKEDEQVSKLRGLHNALESDDSDDEREGDKKKPQVGLHNKSKTIKKDDSDEFRQHISKIAAKSAGKRIQEEGLDITPRLAFNKKRQVKVLKQKIESGGTSKYEDTKSKEMFKDAPTFTEQLRNRIAKKKKLNMQKINTIKVKRVVDK